MTQRGPILDRPLEPAWLDAALTIAARTDDPGEARAQLRVVLGDSRLGAVAQVKTVTALVRIWVQPAAHTRAAIEWAKRELIAEPDPRAIHFGAMLAAYPFFGDVCATVGRALALEEQVATPDLRARLRASWGDRRSVHNAVQRAVKTLRAFDVLSGAPGTSISRRGQRLSVSPHALRWIAHVLLLSRDGDAIDERSLRPAPELFGLDLPEHGDDAYALLERHREGGGRTVLARSTAATP